MLRNLQLNGATPPPPSDGLKRSKALALNSLTDNRRSPNIEVSKLPEEIRGARPRSIISERCNDRLNSRALIITASSRVTLTANIELFTDDRLAPNCIPDVVGNE